MMCSVQLQLQKLLTKHRSATLMWESASVG